MDETKFKKIEARLNQLFAQIDQDRNKKSPATKTSSGVRVIRRRKGKPDFHIS